MIYVCAAWPEREMPEEICHRLYAYPRVPQHAAFTILDSGAFGLAQVGRRIDAAHMDCLAEYYVTYANDGVYCIAPDVYLDPAQTMYNWGVWKRKYSHVPVVPVIQFRRPNVLDVSLALYQARFYASVHPDMIAISNPGMWAAGAGKTMVQICQLVRRITGVRHIHCLGAGWSPRDIAQWRDMQCFDSVDSIAWYKNAQEGILWRADGKCERSDLPWREIARVNAQVATQIATWNPP